MAIELGTAYISILPSTDKLAPAIRKELGTVQADADRAGDTAGRRFGGRFKSAVGGLLKGGVLAGIAGASLLGGAGLKTAAELEQSKIGFETMLGSAKEADRFLAKIKSTAAKTPFELPGLTQASQRLLAFGFQAKDVIPTLTTLGDAAAGLGIGQEGLDRIVMAVGQIQAKGKVQGEEILQLTEAGIPAAKILRNELGLTADEYEEMQRKGKITAEKALPALLNGIKNGTKGLAGETAAFGGLMEKQSKSLSGLFSTLKDTVLVGMAGAIEPLLPLIKGGLAGAIKAVGPGMDALGRGAQGLVSAFSGGGGGMGAWASSLRSLADSVGSFVKGLLPTVKDVGGSIMKAVGPGLVAIGEVVRKDLFPAIERLLPVLMPVAKFLLQMFGSAVVGLIKGVVQAVKGLIQFVSGVVNLFVSLIKGDWSGAWDALKQIVSGAVNFVVGLIKAWWNFGILAVFRQGAKLLVNVFRKGWGLLRSIPGKAFGLIEKVVKGAFKGLLRLFVGAVKGYVRLWKGLFSGLKNLAVEGWKVLRSAFGGAVAAIRTVITKAISAYVNFWKGLFTRLRDAASKGWDLIKSGFSKALDAVKSAFSKAVDGIQKIWDGIKSAASKPVRFVIDTVYNNGLRKMIGAIPGVSTPPAIGVGFSSGGWTGPGQKYQAAGVVHADEFVVSKAARRALEAQKPGWLDFMNRTGRWPGYAGGGRVWPLAGARAGTYAGHDGVDFNVGSGWDDYGLPIRNAASGTVSYVGTGRGYGLATFVRGSYGELVYGHMSRAAVSAGQKVGAGRVLGYVGNTGNSSAPHLHFGFPGGTYSQALAFLSGANVVGGGAKPEPKPGGFSLGAWKDAFGTIKDVALSLPGKIRSLGSSGWGGMIGDSARSLARSAIQWVNDKIPNKWLPDNPIPTGIFDNGGVLEPGAIAYNASRKPEAVFNHRQFQAFAESAGQAASARPRRTEFVITNWHKGEGYFREIADDVFDDRGEFANMTRRMG